MSIRTRLFLSISALIVFFVVFSLILNSQFLEKYYVWQKKAALTDIQKRINEIYKGNPDAISLELENLERNSGLNIYILKSDLEVKYNSLSRFFNNEHREKALQRKKVNRDDSERMPPEGPPDDGPMSGRQPFLRTIETKLNKLTVKGDSFADEVRDPRLKTKFLILASRMNNGEYLVLSTPIVAISESTDIANRFFLFTGFITVLLGGIVIYFYTNRFTKPILALNHIAQEMAKLDFSKKYTGHSDDEIGQLGASINSLSDQLDRAISELTEANSKLIEDIERERRIDKMRKEFISNVSHELKTPIALIQGYAEGLKLNVNDDEENKNFYCDVIMDESDKMNRLVTDLLDLSQVESGYFNLEVTDFNLSSLINHVVDKYKPIFAEKGIKLGLDNKYENAVVQGDVIRIEQVLFNFLNNAINHVDDNKIINIAVSAYNNKMHVSVFNSGKNIPEDSLDKLWDSFYKVDKARTRAYGGTGLGLSVVKAIMERHENNYGVENKENGVLFWFELDFDIYRTQVI